MRRQVLAHSGEPDHVAESMAALRAMRDTTYDAAPLMDPVRVDVDLYEVQGRSPHLPMADGLGR